MFMWPCLNLIFIAVWFVYQYGRACCPHLMHLHQFQQSPCNKMSKHCFSQSTYGRSWHLVCAISVSPYPKFQTRSKHLSLSNKTLSLFFIFPPSQLISNGGVYIRFGRLQSPNRFVSSSTFPYLGTYVHCSRIKQSHGLKDLWHCNFHLMKYNTPTWSSN